MDITSTATATANVKTPEAETETPTRIQPTKAIPFTNGVLKRHHRTPSPALAYKECLKNHAASLGGHALDGCGEFMPSPTATPSDPTSLKCAACGCHRNFHRREPEELLHAPSAVPAIEYQPHHRHHPPPPPPPQRAGGLGSSPNSPSPPPISSAYYPSAPHMLLALSTGLSGPGPDNNPSIAAAISGNPNGRKRFRTKFTQDQKERMLEFAERVGWKIQKRDEELISEFCNDVGVDRGVLKVWMHNNKNTFGKKDQSNNNNNGVSNSAGNGNRHSLEATQSSYSQPLHDKIKDENYHSHTHQELSRHLLNNDIVSHAHVAAAAAAAATNGSSSSS